MSQVWYNFHMTALSAIYRKNENIVSRTIGDEVILVPIRKESGDLDNIFTLNELAAFIWNALDGNTSLEQIGSMITSDYEVTSEDAARDLLGCIADLESINAVAIV